MSRRYRITPKGRSQQPTDSEIARYRDPKRLMYNYERAVRKPRRPIYRDPKAFLVLLLIVLLTLFITEVVEKKGEEATPEQEMIGR